MNSRKRVRLALAGAAIILLLLLITRAMFKRLDHDENQFIASAALLARRGLLPYRDYPHFHMPYLVAVYALLFRLSDHLLLAARLFSTACGFATVALIACVTWRLFGDAAPSHRKLITAASVIALVCNPLFMFTSGRAWNHDLPMLLMLVAFLAICHRALPAPTSAPWAAAAGALMGIATGVRLTFAPPALLLGGLICACPLASARRRIALTAAYVVGVVVALTPCALLVALAPRQFFFGNLRYPFLNTAYRVETQYGNSMEPLGKLSYLLRNVLNHPGNAAVAILAGASVIVYLVCRPRDMAHDAPRRFQINCLGVMVLALLAGAFAPTPLFTPYFYPPIAFLLLLALYIGSSGRGRRNARGFAVFMALAAAACLPEAYDGYHDVARFFRVSEYVPVQVHADGRELATRAGYRRILTLAPIYPLEGHADIYEQFASGPFAWRVAPFVGEADEERFKIPDVDDLDTLLNQDPPSAVLLSTELQLDAPLEAYARRHGIPLFSVTKEGRLSEKLAPHVAGKSKNTCLIGADCAAAPNAGR